MSKIDDEALIEAIRKNENSKYIELMYKRFFEKVKTIVHKGGGNQDDAKDLLHDTVLIFFKHVREQKYKLDTDIDAYLYTVAKNRWINKAVRDKRMVHTDKSIEMPNTQSSHLHTIYSKERAMGVKNVLEQLGDRCKELLNLIYFEELSMNEICARMGYTTSDVAKTKHYKCKQRMVAYINQHVAYKELLSKN